MIFKYISANELLIDSFRLGQKIYQTGFIPTRMVSLWRGGTVIGLGVDEFFRSKGHFINHTTMATASYNGLGSHGDVLIKNPEYLIESISSEDKLLIIDDIYDSGRTIDAVIKKIKSSAGINAPKEIVVGCIHQKQCKRDFSYNVVYLYDVPPDMWLSYPHEISELIGVKDGGADALQLKSGEICNILQATDYDITVTDSTKPYIYLDNNELLSDSMKLAANIYHGGFIPNFIIAVWPFGVGVGLPLHEYFKYKLTSQGQKNMLPDHISIDVMTSDNSACRQIIDIPYLQNRINHKDRVLLVTADFADGSLINDVMLNLKHQLQDNFNIDNVKTACVYYSPAKVKCADKIIFNKPHYFLKQADKPVILPNEIHKLDNEDKLNLLSAYGLSEMC